MPVDEGVAATDRLLRAAFGMHRVKWPNDPGIEFHLLHGDWVRLLRRCGFTIEDLLEVGPAAGATTSYPFVTFEYGKRAGAHDRASAAVQAAFGPAGGSHALSSSAFCAFYATAGR